MVRAGMGAGCLLVLLTATVCLMPWFVRTDLTRDSMTRDLSAHMGGKVDFDEIQISYFPIPRLIVQRLNLDVPGRFLGTVESITAYPRILPLLFGRVHLGRVTMESPVFTLILPNASPLQRITDGADGSSQEPSSGPTPGFMDSLEQTIGDVMVPVMLKMPDLAITVSDGVLELAGSQGVVFWFRDIQSRVDMPPGKLSFSLRCKSNLWSNLVMEGWGNPSDLSSSFRLSVNDFRNEALQEPCRAFLPSWLGRASLNLDMQFQSTGPRDMEADFSGSIPSLVLMGDGREYTLRADAVEGRCSLKNTTFSGEVSRMALSYPQAILKGKFTLDSSIPMAALDLESRETDADAVRGITLGLAGNHPNVHRIFHIIRGGHVPKIAFSAKAPTPALLGKAENYVISGSMEHGRIFVPNVLLHVEEASGEVVIADGILDGQRLSGRTAGSRGADGSLKIGLVTTEGAEKPFQLDIRIDADLVELQPVLQRVVKHDLFLRELALIDNVKGRAQGRLLLGDTLNALKTKVEVDTFTLEGFYRRLPHPAEIMGGPFLLEESSLFFHSTRGRLGNSTFWGIDAAVDWGSSSMLHVVSNPDPPFQDSASNVPKTPLKAMRAMDAARARRGQGKNDSLSARIFLDELYPWFLSLDSSKRYEKHIESARGYLDVDSVSISGSWRSLRELQVHARGALEDAQLKWTFIPTLLSIKSGRFDALPGALNLENMQVSFWDASCIVSGALQGNADKFERADIQIQGTVGQQSKNWFSGILHIPPNLRVRAPLTLFRSRFIREKDLSISYTADMGVKDGPDLSVDVQWSEGSLAFKSLQLKDNDSNATSSLVMKNGEIDIHFNGALSKGSVERLLQENHYLKGSIRGNFQWRLTLDKAMDSTATGELDIEGFRYDGNDSPPVEVERASLAASGHRLTVRSSRVHWKGFPLDLTGTVDLSVQGFNVDMKAAADHFVWGQDAKGTEPDSKSSVTSDQHNNGSGKTAAAAMKGRGDLRMGPPTLFGLPLRGRMDVMVQSLSLGKLTWNPFGAMLSFMPEGVAVEMREAKTCSIPTPGNFKISPEGLQLQVKVATPELPVEPCLECFWKKTGLMNGSFKLTSDLEIAAPVYGDFLKALEGKIELRAEKGRIFRLGFITKVFAMLNLTEIYRGQFPDIIQEGFAYDSIQMKGTIRDGRLLMEESLIEGPSVKMAFHGEVDLVEKRMDVLVVVAPLKTVDRLVDSIPVLGKLLGGTLTSIPVRVAGEVEDPHVFPLAPSAVGSELLGILKRTLKLPLTLIQPFF